MVEKCSPKEKGETLEYSCYTPETLHKIKEIWNARHQDVKIRTNNTKEIWESLRRLMSSSCNKESCWLKHKCLKNGMDGSTLQKTFAPYQPLEWKKKPNEWLSSVDIQKVMKQYEKAYRCFEFMGPSPIDFDAHKLYGECVWEELCKFSLLDSIKRGKTKIGIIFNLDKHTQSGSHWVAMFINTKKRNITYMDSYGDEAPEEVDALAIRIQKQATSIGMPFEYNTTTLRHQYSNSECGMYCLHFIIESVKGKDWTYFNKIKISDNKMKRLRKIYFNVNN